MSNTAILVIFIVVMVVALFFVPRWRMKRASRQVIRIFRNQNATTAKNAKTIDELGLRPRGMVEGMFQGRDYKPNALSVMESGGIIVRTEDDRYYLSEDKLAASGFEGGPTNPYLR